jgi:hypothetical protein
VAVAVIFGFGVPFGVAVARVVAAARVVAVARVVAAVGAGVLTTKLCVGCSLSPQAALVNAMTRAAAKRAKGRRPRRFTG